MEGVTEMVVWLGHVPGRCRGGVHQRQPPPPQVCRHRTPHRRNSDLGAYGTPPRATYTHAPCPAAYTTHCIITTPLVLLTLTRPAALRTPHTTSLQRLSCYLRHAFLPVALGRSAVTPSAYTSACGVSSPSCPSSSQVMLRASGQACAAALRACLLIHAASC